jgi:Intracellular proteinase inhibitor
LIKTSGGKLVEQWSQDQAFTHDPTIVTVNPGERAEYRVEVATRDLSAGQSYVVQGFFPNYEALKAEAMLVPEK